MRARTLVGIGCGALGATLVGVALLIALTARGRAGVDGVVRLLQTDELSGRELATSADVLEYLLAHPERYALALWNVGAEDAGVFHDADRPWPLASTVKIIPLALASELVAAGEWTPDAPVEELERYYLPGTDGDAHPTANAALDGGAATLGNALAAMIRFSDNAATDTIVLRLGRGAVTAGSARLVEAGLPAMHPLCGTMILARSALDGGAPRDAVDDAAWAIATRLRDDQSFAAQQRAALRPLPISDQEELARQLDNRGTARAFARLVERIYSTPGPAFALARERLAWPMEFARNRQDLAVFGTKGGSLPGVLTSASYVETRTGQRRVLALFLHDLPFATWLQLARSYAHQKLEHELLTRPDALDALRERLEHVDAGH